MEPWLLARVKLPCSSRSGRPPGADRACGLRFRLQRVLVQGQAMGWTYARRRFPERPAPSRAAAWSSLPPASPAVPGRAGHWSDSGHLVTCGHLVTRVPTDTVVSPSGPRCSLREHTPIIPRRVSAPTFRGYNPENVPDADTCCTARYSPRLPRPGEAHV